MRCWLDRKAGRYAPEIAARVDDAIPGGLLPDAFLHKRHLVAEHLHGQLVVTRLEQSF